MRRFFLLVPALVAALSACAHPNPAASATAASPVPAATPAASPAAESVTDVADRTAWAVPDGEVKVTHTTPVPPVPELIEVRTGEHADFTRLTFAFRGPFPSYTYGYVRQVTSDGRGDPVALPGRAFVVVRFNPAQGSADSTVHPVNHPGLAGYAQVGNYEGYVTYGLGLTGRVPLRVGESTRPDGTHVVFIDVCAP